MHKISLLLAVSCALLVPRSPFACGEDKSAGAGARGAAKAKTRLADKGVRVTRSGLTLTDEARLTKAFSEANSLRKKLKAAVGSLNQLEQQEEEAKETFQGLLRQNVELSRQLNHVPRTNPLLYNSVISEMKASDGEIRLLQESRKESERQIDEARKTVNSTRENYVQKVFDLRALADRVSARYAELAKDDEAQAALREWNSGLPKPLSLEPSRGFQNALKRLEALEKTVVSDKIALRRKGGSLLATVVINGNHTQEMVVDTGCTLMSLPHEIAVECGVRFDAARDARVRIADGSVAKGKIVKLDSVRVGKFTAHDVECGVFPPEAGHAPPLLGMSFLGRFKVELNGVELVLSNVDGTAGISGHKDSVRRMSKKRTTRPKVPLSTE